MQSPLLSHGGCGSEVELTAVRIRSGEQIVDSVWLAIGSDAFVRLLPLAHEMGDELEDEGRIWRLLV